VVYAAGARSDVSFDISLQARGLEVHTFDPTLKLQKIDKVIDDATKAGVKFHDLGLGGESKVYLQGQVPYVWPGVGYGKMTNDEPWKMYTLGGLLNLLNHTARDIEVLKIDVEGAEWSFFEQALRDPQTAAFLKAGRLRQILMEIHYMPTRGPNFASNPKHPKNVAPYNHLFRCILQELEKIGFKMMWESANTEVCHNIGLIWVR